MSLIRTYLITQCIIHVAFARFHSKHTTFRGSQSVEQPTLAQVMISRSMSSSPVSGSVLTARSLDPASDPVPPSLSVPPPLMLCLSLPKINTQKKLKKHTHTHTHDIWGTWMAQLVRQPTLDLGSGHDLAVGETEPRLGLCPGSTEPASDSLSPLPSLCPASPNRTVTVCLCQSK